MPIYDVKCATCGFEETVTLRIAELEAWDGSTACPSCHAGQGAFRRIIKKAPSTHEGKNLTHRSAGTTPKYAIGSAEKDEMRHKASRNVDRDQVAAARESVAKGEFEGF